MEPRNYPIDLSEQSRTPSGYSTTLEAVEDVAFYDTNKHLIEHNYYGTPIRHSKCKNSVGPTKIDRTVTMKTQAVKNHWILQTVSLLSIPANNKMVDAGIETLVNNKSAKAMLTINAFPKVGTKRIKRTN